MSSDTSVKNVFSLFFQAGKVAVGMKAPRSPCSDSVSEQPVLVEAGLDGL